MLRLIIIGSSIAGVSAAEAARARDPECSITLLTEDTHLPYYRQRLGEVLENPAAADRLMLHPEEWYSERRIDLRLNCRVVGLDADNKTVTLQDGQTLPYDRLVLATGSYSFVPPIPGVHLPGVETLWTMEDALRIERRIAETNRCLVIGGGLLGLEAACAFLKRGHAGPILERLPRLMMRQLDERAAALFTARVEREGSSVKTNAEVAEIYAGEDGKAAGVRLADGSEYPADLILISAGVRARTELLQKAGLRIERCIPVDAHMRTGLPDVYAVGDCAVLDGQWYGLWMVAKGQGAVAGENAVGANSVYQTQVPPYMVNTMGTRIASAGVIQEEDLPAEDAERLHVDVTENSDLFQYEKKLYLGDKLGGFILLGDTKAFSSLNKELRG